MEHSTQLWAPMALLFIILLAIVPLYAIFRIWRGRPRLTAEERHEAAAAPLTRLQKNAWMSVAVGTAVLGLIAALVNTYGAAEYWDNDVFRLTVVGLFIGGLAACAALLAVSVAGRRDSSRLDERDRQVLARAGTYQTGFVIIALAVWLIALGERFHDEGAVPMVYLNLMFGSIILVTLIGQAVGVLIGYWVGERFGQE